MSIELTTEFPTVDLDKDVTINVNVNNISTTNFHVRIAKTKGNYTVTLIKHRVLDSFFFNQDFAFGRSRK